MKKSILSELFLTFMKIGLFTFGGGYAMISVIEDSCVEKKKWITHDDMMNVTVIAESTPGPMAINCATFVGYKQAGLAGAAAATLGIILPSFVIIYLISMFLENFITYPLVAQAFQGIRIAVGILIVKAGLNMMKKMQKKPLPRVIMLCALLLILAAELFGRKLSTIVLMVCAGVFSLALFCAKKGGKTK